MAEEKNPFEESDDLKLMTDPLPPVDFVRDMKFTAQPITAPQTSLDEAMEIVAAHLDSGAPFTNAQLNLCTKVIATQLPDGDRDMLREISETQGFPPWICLLAQWRRCCEYAEQFAVLTDPDWIEKMERKD